MNDYKVIKAAMEKVTAPIEDPEVFNTWLVDEYQHTPYVNEKVRMAQYPSNEQSEEDPNTEDPNTEPKTEQTQ